MLSRRSFLAGVSAAAAGAEWAAANELRFAGAGARKSLIVSSGVDIVGLSAFDVGNVVPDRMLFDHVADTLLAFGDLGQTIPSLAIACDRADDRAWDLTLRENVVFHNGEKFDAESVRLFFALMNDPKTVSSTKSNHVWVERVEVFGPHKARLISREPYPVARGQLTLAHMIPPEYIKSVGLEAYRRRPVGTGAYRFIEHVRDDHVTLEAFDRHWRGVPAIRSLVYRPVKESSARVAALMTGEIDVALELPPELTPMLRANARAGAKSVLSTQCYLLLLNNLNPAYPTTSKLVREAINYAIDRNSLNANILDGTGAPAAWLNPTTLGYESAIAPIGYDPQRARQLLAEAGHPNGIDLVIDSSHGKYIKDKEMAEGIAGQMQAAGIRARVDIHGWDLLTKKIWARQTSPATLIAWTDTNLDPDIQNSRVLRTGATWSQTSDQKLDAIIDAIKTEMDQDKRIALIKEQQRYMRELLPVAYLVQTGAVVGVAKDMSGWEPSPNGKHWFLPKA